MVPPTPQFTRGTRNDLHDAAFHGSTERTIALLSAGLIDIDQGDHYGYTPLVFAAQQGHARVARILLNRGANTSIATEDGDTPLHRSARLGHTAVTVHLIEAGADLNARGEFGSSPLHLAAREGHSEVMAALIEAGADLNTRDEYGFSPLLLAADEGHSEVMAALIEAGADLNTRNEYGFSPLHLAADKGHSEVMAALIEAGADVNSRSGDMATPLYMAALTGRLDAVRELLRAKANPLLARTTSPGMYFVPLETAAELGHSEVVRELIQQVGIESCGGVSGGADALMDAAKMDHVDVIATLMDAGVVDAGVALYSAAGCGREAAVKLLLQRRHLEGSPTGLVGYVNWCTTHTGRTPLLHCIDGFVGEEGVSPLISVRVVQLLIDDGADTSSVVRVTNSQGEVIFNATPLAIIDDWLHRKKVGGNRDATEEQMYRLEAVRRLLLRVEAVYAVSWLWLREPLLVSGAADVGSWTGRDAATSSTHLRLMLPLLRRRRRGALLAPLFRYSSYP